MAAKTNIISPMDVLIKGYQTNYVNDKSRWKYGLWSRQTGKDFVSEFEAVQSISVCEMNKEKQDWLVAAPSERQSLESLGKAKEHVRAFGLAVASAVRRLLAARQTPSACAWRDWRDVPLRWTSGRTVAVGLVVCVVGMWGVSCVPGPWAAGRVCGGV